MPFNVTKFSVYYIRVQGVHAKYASDQTTVVGFYHKVDEFEDVAGVVVPWDSINDDDVDRYGVLVDQKFGGGWGVVGSIWMAKIIRIHRLPW